MIKKDCSIIPVDIFFFFFFLLSFFCRHQPRNLVNWLTWQSNNHHHHHRATVMRYRGKTSTENEKNEWNGSIGKKNKTKQKHNRNTSAREGKSILCICKIQDTDNQLIILWYSNRWRISFEKEKPTVTSSIIREDWCFQLKVFLKNVDIEGPFPKTRWQWEYWEHLRDKHDLLRLRPRQNRPRMRWFTKWNCKQTNGLSCWFE